MKTMRTLFLSLILLGVAAGTGSAATSVSAGIHIGPSGHASVDVGFFYDDLATYGNWVERPNYGWAWRPHRVASSWRPYQAGHWVWTDEGWTWISDEPYGWATYHYGRWYDDPDYGWEWIPGEQWAPAWVAWQEGGDYVGWAPLPPSVDFRPGIELTVSLAPELYVFVPERQFLAPRLSGYYAPRADCVRLYHSTRNITRYNVVNNRIFNQGVQVDRLQRVVGRPVPRYQLADLNADQRHQGGRVAQNRVAIFRPQVDKVKVAPPPSRPIAKRAVMTGAAAAALVAAHHATQGKNTGNVPPATGRLTKEERRQIAQAPPQHGRSNREAQPVPQAKRPPAVQDQQQEQAWQQKNQDRQAQRQAAQQKSDEQKAQRQAAQQQRAEQRQAQKQEAQQRPPQRQEAQQPRTQRQPPERQAAQQQGQQRQGQAQRQAPPQPKNQGKPPGKPRDEKQKPPPQ